MLGRKIGFGEDLKSVTPFLIGRHTRDAVFEFPEASQSIKNVYVGPCSGVFRSFHCLYYEPTLRTHQLRHSHTPKSRVSAEILLVFVADDGTLNLGYRGLAWPAKSTCPPAVPGPFFKAGVSEEAGNVRQRAVKQDRNICPK